MLGVYSAHWAPSSELHFFFFKCFLGTSHVPLCIHYQRCARVAENGPQTKTLLKEVCWHLVKLLIYPGILQTTGWTWAWFYHHRWEHEELKCTAVQSALHLGFGAVYLRSGLGPRTVPLGNPLNKSSGPGWLSNLSLRWKQDRVCGCFQVQRPGDSSP